MTPPCDYLNTPNSTNSQGMIIPTIMRTENPLETQIDQISQPAFTSHNVAYQNRSDHLYHNDRELNSSSTPAVRKRTRTDEMQGASKRACHREEKEGNQNQSIQKMTYPNGSIYEGEFKEGKPHGHGKVTSTDGRAFEGEYQDGKPHGHGKTTSTDGRAFEGEYRNGKPHGHGKTTSPDGKIFEGEYQDGKAHGCGKMILPDGRIIEGEYKEGKLNGCGKITSPDGSIYEGEVKEGQPHGRGKKTFLDNRIYEGTFKDGKMNGCGKMIFLDGSIFEGEFKEDHMLENGKWTYPERIDFDNFAFLDEESFQQLLLDQSKIDCLQGNEEQKAAEKTVEKSWPDFLDDQ
jgi:hypothetical protein